MKLLDYNVPVETIPTSNPLTIYLRTDDSVTEVAEALAGQPLQLTNAGVIVAVYPDYQITGITQEQNGIIAVTAARALEPSTAATLQRLEFAHQQQQAINQAAQEWRDETDAALFEIAGIVGGE